MQYFQHLQPPHLRAGRFLEERYSDKYLDFGHSSKTLISLLVVTGRGDGVGENFAPDDQV